jgi:hypothetical protein
MLSLGLPASAQPGGHAPVRVLVSRREVRVVFPPDTAHRWGWTAKKANSYAPTYQWGIDIDGIDGPRSFGFGADRFNDSSARSFTSLRQLIATDKPGLCSGGMVTYCDKSRATAFVENRSVVIVLRDSAVIRRLFGLRPTHVTSWQRIPTDTASLPREDSVRVEYVAPQIPEPDSAFKAEAVRAHRRYYTSVHRSYRELKRSSGDRAGPIWLNVGDSTSLSVFVIKCASDFCSERNEDTYVAGLTVDDTSIAELRTPAASEGQRRLRITPQIQLLARRPGTTTVRLRGLPIDADEEEGGRKSQRELARAVFVAPAIARVELSPRRDTVRVHESVEFHLRAIDITGEVIEHLPASLTVDNEPASGELHTATDPLRVMFRTAGTRILIGRLGSHADTLRITVVPAVKH